MRVLTRRKEGQSLSFLFHYNSDTQFLDLVDSSFEFKTLNRFIDVRNGEYIKVPYADIKDPDMYQSLDEDYLWVDTFGAVAHIMKEWVLICSLILSLNLDTKDTLDKVAINIAGPLIEVFKNEGLEVTDDLFKEIIDKFNTTSIFFWDTICTLALNEIDRSKKLSVKQHEETAKVLDMLGVSLEECDWLVNVTTGQAEYCKDPDLYGDIPANEAPAELWEDPEVNGYEIVKLKTPCSKKAIIVMKL